MQLGKYALRGKLKPLPLATKSEYLNSKHFTVLKNFPHPQLK